MGIYVYTIDNKGLKKMEMSTSWITRIEGFLGGEWMVGK
jgi:hypothetical protein